MSENDLFDPLLIHVRSVQRAQVAEHDMGSLNGTYVNQERIEEAVLAHGDEVQIGRYRMVFFESAM